MKTLLEQVQSIAESRQDLQETLKHTVDADIRRYVGDRMDALLDAAETLKHLNDLVEFVDEARHA